jgi:hypothetical protein
MREAFEADNRALLAKLDRQEVMGTTVGADAGFRGAMGNVGQAKLRLGLPAATEDDLFCAMFSFGLRTKTDVSTLSCRGIELSAVRQQVNDLGGQIAFSARPNHGSCFRFSHELAYTYVFRRRQAQTYAGPATARQPLALKQNREDVDGGFPV